MARNSWCNAKQPSGFTLIELVIGILVFAIAMSMMLTLILPQAKRSIDPIFQLRATELANTLINEIQGKAFDENSNPALGLLPCDTDVLTAPCSINLSAEETGRDFWDDVDDYNGFDIDGASLFSGAQYSDDYANFKLEITVIYDGNYDGVDQGTDALQRAAKLITVKVTTPNDEAIEFATYRSNY